MAQGHALQMIPPGSDSTEMNALSVRSGSEAEGSPAQALAPQEAGAGNVEKIRDILFGPQMRDYELRFMRLEDKVSKDLADLRDAARKRADAIESFVHGEFEAVHTRLRAERDERSAGMRQLARDLNELTNTLSQKIQDLDEQTAQAQRQLRVDLLELSKTFSEDLGQKHEEISTLIDKRFQELRKGKTDRATLASLLTEMSLKLSGELSKTVPEA